MNTTTIDSSLDNKLLEAQKSSQESLKIHQQQKLAYQNKYRLELKLEGEENKLNIE